MSPILHRRGLHRRDLMACLCTLGLLAAGLLAACSDSADKANPSGLAQVDSGGALMGDAAGDATPADTVGPETTPPPSDTSEPDASEPDASQPDTSQPDTSEPDTSEPDTVEEGPFVTIIVRGSLDDFQPNDGLAAQTPDPYIYGLQKLELLRTADDPAPHVVFDYDPGFVEVDMHGDNVVAKVPIPTLPTDTFSHFRITLSHLEIEVDATIHGVPVIETLSTRLQVFYALSDLQDQAGKTFDQGEAVATATLGGQTYETPYDWAVEYPNPGPNAWADSFENKTRVTFTMNPLLDTVTATPIDLTYVNVYYILGSFRWQDQAQPGYTEDVWDSTLGPPPAVEPVLRLGANAYQLFLQTGPAPSK